MMKFTTALWSVAQVSDAIAVQTDYPTYVHQDRNVGVPLQTKASSAYPTHVHQDTFFEQSTKAPSSYPSHVHQDHNLRSGKENSSPNAYPSYVHQDHDIGSDKENASPNAYPTYKHNDHLKEAFQRPESPSSSNRYRLREPPLQDEAVFNILVNRPETRTICAGFDSISGDEAMNWCRTEIAIMLSRSTKDFHYNGRFVYFLKKIIHDLTEFDKTAVAKGQLQALSALARVPVVKGRAVLRSVSTDLLKAHKVVRANGVLVADNMLESYTTPIHNQKDAPDCWLYASASYLHSYLVNQSINVQRLFPWISLDVALKEKPCKLSDAQQRALKKDQEWVKKYFGETRDLATHIFDKDSDISNGSGGRRSPLVDQSDLNQRIRSRQRRFGIRTVKESDADRRKYLEQVTVDYYFVALGRAGRGIETSGGSISRFVKDVGPVVGNLLGLFARNHRQSSLAEDWKMETIGSVPRGLYKLLNHGTYAEAKSQVFANKPTAHGQWRMVSFYYSVQSVHGGHGLHVVATDKYEDMLIKNSWGTDVQYGCGVEDFGRISATHKGYVTVSRSDVAKQTEATIYWIASPEI